MTKHVRTEGHSQSVMRHRESALVEENYQPSREQPSTIIGLASSMWRDYVTEHGHMMIAR